MRVWSSTTSHDACLANSCVAMDPPAVALSMGSASYCALRMEVRSVGPPAKKHEKKSAQRSEFD